MREQGSEKEGSLGCGDLFWWCGLVCEGVRDKVAEMLDEKRLSLLQIGA